MRVTATAVLVRAVLALAACGGSGGKKLSDRQLAKLVLQPSDLPSGYDRFAEGATRHAELEPVLHGDESRFSRQGGWTARYRTTGSSQRGPLTVVSTVDVFSDASGAGKFLAALRKYDATTGAASGLKEVRVQEVGDETHAVATARATRGSIRYFIVAWRDGRIVGGVSASGFAERLGLGDVVALVRRQEKRSAPVS
jgi:hypothetical protein